MLPGSDICLLRLASTQGTPHLRWHQNHRKEIEARSFSRVINGIVINILDQDLRVPGTGLKLMVVTYFDGQQVQT